VYRKTSLDDLDRIRIGGADWRPIRRTLGVTGFGVAAFTGVSEGDEVIEPHDELSPGAGRHEELYHIARGHATFVIDGETVDAPAGALILIPPGTRREAHAAVDDTTVVVVGGVEKTVRTSPFEYWYAAEPAYASGDFEQAIAIASEGLADYPDNPTLNYQLACFHARAGHGDEAIAHLKTAIAANSEIAEWARTDDDFDSIRGDDRFPSAA
jgi:tetratricopeptide (TPR) repeat protein